MHTANFAHEHGMPSSLNATTSHWWETTYTTVSWDYPPSPAAYYNALLSRGALHSRFLRIAYSSTCQRPPSSTPSSSASSTTSLTPTHPLSPTSSADSPRNQPSRPHVNSRPRSAHPSHTLKRRKPQWPKPPHYHASLLRSSLSHRKGLFRAVLSPNKAVDFFRWDIFLGAGVSFSAPRQERVRTRSGDADACASLHVAEFVLEPYEAAAGFFGWHGLGFDVIHRVQGRCDEDVDDTHHWSPGVVCRPSGTGKCRSSRLRFEIDEAIVDEGRARWARTAEELVGPRGLGLRWFVQDGKHALPPDLAHRDPRAPLSLFSSHDEVRWDPDIGYSPFQPSTSDEKREQRPSTSKLDPPSAWWCSPHRGPPPPHPPPHRLPPPPLVQYGFPPVHFSPCHPSSRTTSVHGHGYWYGAQPFGPPSSINRDPNLAKPLPTHSHTFTVAVAPTLMHPSQSPTKSNSGRNDYEPGRDYDRETETDHGYESTTTTTDSDPPPHTPIGATTTSHCVEASQGHRDDEVDVEIHAEHVATSLSIDMSDPDTPAKLHGRFSIPPSPSVLSGSPDSERAAYRSSKATVVFPSLNGTFRQEASPHMSVASSGQGMPMQMTPVRMTKPVSLPSAKETSLGLDSEDNSEKSGDLERSDNPALMLSLCSPSTSPGGGLRKNSQGFWEPAIPISPCSSSSSLPVSPTECQSGPRHATGWTGEEGLSMRDTSSQFALLAKSRSLSPGLRPVTSVGTTYGSNSRPASFPSPTSTPASMSVFGGSYPSSPSPNNGSLVPPNTGTLLPAFLATATVKRKKTSRTREIVDRLRSSSIDAGKGGVGADGLGWLASPSASREPDSTPDKVSTGSEHPAGSHVAGEQPSQPSPPKSGSESTPRVGSDLRKNHGQAPGSKPLGSGSSGSGSKGNGATAGSETHFPHASSKPVATTTNTSITPFPILSVSQNPASHFTVTHQNSINGATHGGDGPKMNATATSPIVRNPGPQLLSGPQNGGTSPSTHASHHPLPSPSQPIVHPPPALGPPPMLAVSAYPPPMYVPFTQYHLAPPHQGPQGQGAWLAIYPGRPAHLPVHPMPVQAHVPPITGTSGMRHTSW